MVHVSCICMYKSVHDMCLLVHLYACMCSHVCKHAHMCLCTCVCVYMHVCFFYVYVCVCLRERNYLRKSSQEGSLELIIFKSRPEGQNEKAMQRTGRRF